MEITILIVTIITLILALWTICKQKRGLKESDRVIRNLMTDVKSKDSKIQELEKHLDNMKGLVLEYRGTEDSGKNLF